MDTASIATAYAGAAQAQTAMAVQAEIMKSQQQAEMALVEVIMQAAELAAEAAAAPPPGMGAHVDVRA